MCRKLKMSRLFTSRVSSIPAYCMPGSQEKLVFISSNTTLHTDDRSKAEEAEAQAAAGGRVKLKGFYDPLL